MWFQPKNFKLKVKVNSLGCIKLGMKPGWLQSVTGIRSRRFWPRHLRPSDVATNAAKGVLQNTVRYAEDRGGKHLSVCKDYLEPSVAAFVHGIWVYRLHVKFDAEMHRGFFDGHASCCRSN